MWRSAFTKTPFTSRSDDSTNEKEFERESETDDGQTATRRNAMIGPNSDRVKGRNSPLTVVQVDWREDGPRWTTTHNHRPSRWSRCQWQKAYSYARGRGPVRRHWQRFYNCCDSSIVGSTCSPDFLRRFFPVVDWCCSRFLVLAAICWDLGWRSGSFPFLPYPRQNTALRINTSHQPQMYKYSLDIRP